MKKYPFLFIFVLAFWSAGCFFKRSPEHLVVEKPSYHYANAGSIHDITALQKGGRILVVPFTAGTGVAADPELDRIALNIIKGLADVLNENGSGFRVITAEEATTADFLLKGHVTERTEPGKLRRWVMMGRTISLGVQAVMHDPQSRKELATFSYRRQVRQNERSFEELGYQIGRAIGEDLL